MLRNYSKLEKNPDNRDGFTILDTKMKQSLDGLSHIQNLLNNKQKAPSLNQDRISQLEQDHLDLKAELIEKNKLLSQNQKNIESEQNKYTQLEQKFNELTQQCKLIQDNSQKDLQQLQIKNNNLQTKINNLDSLVHGLQDLHESEAQRKEQLDLLLRESAQKLKNTTEAALERDQKIEELQQNLDHIKQHVDEKDQLLKTYASKESEEISQMQEEIILLEEVNKRLNEELHDAKHTQIEEQHQKKDDTSNIISSLEQELISCQAQLLEKKSQNQELESAMERVNQHCNVLRLNLNEATEESADRYQRMLAYRDEIRLLKQALHSA